MPNDMMANTPVIDLAAALAPEKLAAWLDYEFTTHATNGAALLARYTKFLEVTTEGIRDDVMVGHAADFVKDLKGEAKATDETRTRIKAPVLHAQRLIDGGGKKLIDPLTAAVTTVEYRVGTFLKAKEVEARRVAEEEAKRLALEAEVAFDVAQQEGTTEAAEVAVEAIQQAQTAAAQATASTIDLTRTRSQAGALTGLRDNWTYRIVDVSKVPAAYLQVNDVVVRAAIKTGTREIAGLEIFNDAKAFVR